MFEDALLELFIHLLEIDFVRDQRRALIIRYLQRVELYCE